MRARSTWALLTAGMVAVIASGCSKNDPGAVEVGGAAVAPVAPDVAAPSGAQRLTRAQYANAIHDVLGDDVVVPAALEPDSYVDGFASIGSSLSSVSPRGIEQYETASYDVAKQALADAAHRTRFVSCTPQGAVDADCAGKFLAAVGRKLWRRPLETDEQATLVAIAGEAGGKLGDFWQGLEFATSALLQSPSFLYRPGIGEPDPEKPSRRRYTSWEMASRLSFFLWNTTPDDVLLDAAAGGALTTEDGLAREVDRLLASPRLEAGLRAFVTEWLGLADLDGLTKDTNVFTFFDTSVGPAAREETLRDVVRLVLTDDGDFRDFFTLDWTYVNPRLAAIYGVESPSHDPNEFARVTLPATSERRGFLGQVAFLALQAHPTSSSSTLRGKFIRTKLLCGTIDPPPANVNTALPQPTGQERTRRDIIDVHLGNPACAGCHLRMEPIGLGLENYDGIGRWREVDDGAAINAAESLDGKPYDGPKQLGQLLHDDVRVPRCVARYAFEYATSFADDDATAPVIDALSEDFVATGHRLRGLFRAIATSPGFGLARDPQ